MTECVFQALKKRDSYLSEQQKKMKDDVIACLADANKTSMEKTLAAVLV